MLPYSLIKNHAFGGKGLIALVCFGFVLFAGIALPPASATFEVSQEPAINYSNQKRTRPAFVPGEALVRYKDEATAKRQLRAAMVRSETGRVMPIQIERFKGSEIVAGLRIARVAP